MKKFSRLAAVMAGLLVLTAGSQAVFANCTNFGAGFPVFQCGFVSWFAPKPATAGNVSTVWWQLGYGNNMLNTGLGGGGALEGTGNSGPGTFNGNDSGNFQMVLTDARTVLGQYASQIPAGSMCSNFENSWSQPGVDGCADNPRTTADNDDFLNRYFSYGPGYYSTNYLIDYPMGVLMTESTGNWFALAFVANRSRGTNPTDRAADTSEGDFDLGRVSNGAPNPVTPGRNNIIPWQQVPKQRVDATTFADPANKQTSDRILALSWPAVTVVSDGSTRPSGRALNNPGNGVGVLDQGDLVRYVVESAPITTATPDPSTLTWTAIGTTGGNTTSVTVPPDTAIRLRTVFGKSPSTTTTSAANCRQGLCGDLGYDVVSGLTIIAGPLVSERAVNVVASKNKNAYAISWESTSELTVTGFEIIGVGGKGDQTIKTVACKKCTSGEGATYDELLTASDLKGAKQVRIKMVGPNTVSDPVELR